MINILNCNDEIKKKKEKYKKKGVIFIWYYWLLNLGNVFSFVVIFVILVGRFVCDYGN